MQLDGHDSRWKDIDSGWDSKRALDKDDNLTPRTVSQCLAQGVLSKGGRVAVVTGGRIVRWTGW